MQPRLCIACGTEFQSDDLGAVLCPACLGQGLVEPVPIEHFPGAGDRTEPEPDRQRVEGEDHEILQADENLGRAGHRVGSSRAPGSDWQPGDVILDTYEVRQVFTSGGMGLVYRVRHRGWNIDLALKSPRPELFVKPEGAESFVREAETWVDLGLHPHIVSCYYVRTIEGIPRIFAEYVEGGSLKDWIEDRRLYQGNQEVALERILDIAIQFAWGLHYAHEQGLVHQDVKPANLLMTPEVGAKVSDFGLAKARLAAGEEVGQVGGGSLLVSSGGYTPAYCSPEQAAQEQLSRRTDIWSWALSILEMFTGEVVWMSGVVAASALDNYLEYGAEGKGMPAMPQSLVELLRECFRDEPKERPKDMLEIAERLIDIYQEATGQVYLKEMPKPAALRADSLNNKALSFLDLGRDQDAEQCFEEALEVDPFHSVTIYNQAVHQWRQAKLDDLLVLNHIKSHLDSIPNGESMQYLLGLIHIARGDFGKAVESLDRIEAHPELESLLEQANQFLEQSGGVHKYKSDRRIIDLAFHPDGRRAVSASESNTINFWDLETKESVQSFKIEDLGLIASIALTPDGQNVITGHRTGFYGRSPTLHLWDYETGTCVNSFGNFDIEVNAIAVHPDGLRILTACSGEPFSEENALFLWDLERGECLRTFLGHDRGIASLIVNKTGTHAFTSSYDRSFGVWNLETGTFRKVKTDIRSAYFPMGLTPDGQFALLAGNKAENEDDTIWFLDLGSEKWVREYKGHKAWVNTIAVHPEGRYFASGGVDRTLRVWDLSTGVCVRSIPTDGEIHCLAFSPNGQKIIFGTTNEIVLLDIGTSLMSIEVPYLVSTPMTAETATTAEQLVTMAQQAFVVGDYTKAHGLIIRARSIHGYEQADQAVDVWHGLYLHLKKGPFRGAWLERTFESHKYQVKAVAFSPEGKYAISGGRERLSEQHTLRLWDVKTGSCINAFKGHDKRVNAIAVSPDGKSFISASNDPTPRLWKIDAQKSSRRIFKGHQGDITSIQYSPDGRLFISGSRDRTAKLWDIQLGKCLRTFKGHEFIVSHVFFNSDGCRMYTLSGCELRVWDIAEGECLQKMTIGRDIRCLQIHPGGSTLLTGDLNGLLHLYDLSTGDCYKSFEGHQYSINAVSFSLDGQFFVSGSNDGTLKLWQLSTGECLNTFRSHEDNVTAVSFNSNSGSILSGSDDHTLKLWMLDWELDDDKDADWDEGARPILETFLTLHTPYAGTLPQDRDPTEEEITLALTRRGKPTWREEDFQRLLQTLGYRGYGWLREQGVRKKLSEMAAKRG